MDAKIFLDIVMTMLEYGMIDKNRLSDYEYVKERVECYLEAKNFVDTKRFYTFVAFLRLFVAKQRVIILNYLVI